MGAAGTGKSLVIQAILNKYQGNIKVASYMAAASYLVGGYTMHATVKLPINSLGWFELSDEKLLEVR